MRKPLHLAVLFCVLLILFSGCGKAQSKDQTLENIRISNLKTASSDLSQEERDYMEDICGILETATFTHDSQYDGSVHGQNNSQHNLNFTVYLCGYDKDGRLVEKSSATLNGLQPGQKFTWKQNAKADNLMLIGLYGYHGIMYMTDSIPLEVVSGQSNTGITINCDHSLPTVVTLNNSASYSLLDFTVQSSSQTYQDVIVLARKESGKDNSGDSIYYRLLDQEGHIHASGSSYIYLNRGETARIIFSVPVYEPGEYYLELY